MTHATVYELYGCPACAWRWWRPLAEHPARVAQVQHDRDRPACPRDEPVMLTDLAKGGART